MALANPRWRSISAAVAIAAAIAAACQQAALAERAQQPKSETQAPRSEDLSKRLDRTDGVIRPPQSIDPDIHVPAPQPNPGTTPVIPPPGTPGGDQSVDPK
jgi:hypothetical protein